MPLYRAFPYLYFFCWIFLAIFQYIYNTNYLYEPLLIFFSVTALYYSFYAISNYKLPFYFKSLFLFVGVLSAYGFVLIFLGDDVFWKAIGHNLRKYLYILWLISSMLSVVPVYVFTCRGWLNRKRMLWIFILLYALSIYAFYGALEIQKSYATLLKIDQDEYTVTSVYSFLSLMPLLLLLKNKKIVQFALLSVMLAFFILGAKRGPIIFGGMSAIILTLCMFVGCSIEEKIKLVFIEVLFFAGIVLFVAYQMSLSPHLSMRFEQTLAGNTSGRDVYVQTIWNYYLNSLNNRQMILGIGAQGTLAVNESFAHNDWLGILLENGILGVFLYGLYWIGFVYTWLKSKFDKDSFIAIGLLIFIGIGKTIFSMYYLPATSEMMFSSGCFSIALGYYLGKVFPQYDKYSEFNDNIFFEKKL